MTLHFPSLYFKFGEIFLTPEYLIMFKAFIISFSAHLKNYLFNFLKRFYLRERAGEHEHEQAQREREKERADSLQSREPDMGLCPMGS